MKGKAGDVGVEMCINSGRWLLNIIMFANDKVLNAGNEWAVLDSVCKKKGRSSR